MPLQPEFALFASRKSAEIDLCAHYQKTRIVFGFDIKR